mgnify:CR=1 FL=1
MWCKRLYQWYKEREEVTKEPSKFDKLKEMWKDKKGRAKIKLCLYLIFFVGVVIFARVLSYQNSKLPHNDNVNNNSFIYTLKDNYELRKIIINIITMEEN